jgi:hypothetical protein
MKMTSTLLDNYRLIALMNSLLKLWTILIKDAGSKYAEKYGILSDQQDGFRLLRSIHDAFASIIMMMEDTKIFKKASTECTRTSEAPSTQPTTVSCSRTCSNSTCPLLW